MSMLSGELLTNEMRVYRVFSNERRANLSRVGLGENSVTGAEVSHVTPLSLSTI